MSANGKLGAKKLRRAQERAGEPLFMAFARGYHVEAVTPDDRHLWLDRDGSAPEEIDDPAHWTTCPSVVAREAGG